MKEKKLGPGQSIIGFDSLEEMLAFMAQREREATEGTLSEQWDITWGARVIRFVDHLVIFGHVFTQREYLAESTPAGKAPDEELLEELDGVRDAHDRGYRYGKWYSEVEPTGEYGSAHVISLWEITRDDFDYARQHGWKVWKELVQRVYSEVGQAMRRAAEE